MGFGGTGIPLILHSVGGGLDACGMGEMGTPRISDPSESAGNRVPSIFARLRIEGNRFPQNADPLTWSAMPRKTNPDRVAKYKGLIKGVKKRWSSSGTRMLGNKNYSHAEVIEQIQSILDAIQETATAYAAWRDCVARQRELERSLRELVGWVEGSVRTEVGNDARLLETFGLQPAKKTGPRTSSAKLAMVQKAKATRVVRRTMGKRQRQKVRGKE